MAKAGNSLITAANFKKPPVRLILKDDYSVVESSDDTVVAGLHKRFTFLDSKFWFYRHKFGNNPWASQKASQVSFVTEKDVQLEDKRKLFHEIIEYEPVTNDIFGDRGIQMHDYQVDIANLALEKKRGIVKCATGGGKTLIFTSILKALKSKYSALMVCRNKSVVDQTYDSFLKNGLENVGRVHMDYMEPDVITCATAQSLHKIPQLVEKAKVLLIDEVHEWASKESQKKLKSFNNATYRLGFSATPWNNDMIHDYKLKAWVGPELCDVGVEFLKDQSILSSCHAHFYKIQCPEIDDPEERTFFNSDNSGIVENELLHQKVVDIIKSIKTGRILILVRRLPHGDRLKEMMPNAHWIRGEDTAETRAYVLDQLRSSSEKKVVAIMSAIGFYGLNVLCHHLINACGGKDANLLIQKVGRGLRKGIDKDHLEYHDFLFEGNRFLHNHSRTRIHVLNAQGHEVTIEGGGSTGL